MESIKNKHIGEINYNFYNTKMMIVEYNNYQDIIVEFQDKYKVRKKCGYKEFKKGMVKNPYDKSVCGVGYIGEGKYKVSKNGKATKCYEVWRSMIFRCYDEHSLKTHPTYIGCEVCEEWHNFQNFAIWFEQNYYELANERVELDKDILVCGNKTYSPTYCIFVPQTINNLFKKRNEQKGIRTDKTGNYIVRGTKDGEMIYLGYYYNYDEAMEVYNNYHNRKIQEVIHTYNNLIPNHVYSTINKVWNI